MRVLTTRPRRKVKKDNKKYIIFCYRNLAKKQFLSIFINNLRIEKRTRNFLM